MKGKNLPFLKEHWDDLLKQGQKLSFHKDQFLCYEGHEPYGIFVLWSGKVDFSQGETSCEEPHLCSFSQGKVIGLHHFFSKTPFCCSCVAVTYCQITFISKTQLLPYLKPGFIK